MTSLKERLAARKRRTLTVPVQVSDPGPARAAYEQAERLLFFTVAAAEAEHPPEDLATREAEARAARDEAAKALAEHYVEVRFVAAAPVDLERILAEHADDKGRWDETAALPHLAALCAVDDELADPQWWADQLASTWTRGEHGSLWTALLDLNLDKPLASLPKD